MTDDRQKPRARPVDALDRENIVNFASRLHDVFMRADIDLRRDEGVDKLVTLLDFLQDRKNASSRRVAVRTKGFLWLLGGLGGSVFTIVGLVIQKWWEKWFP